MTVASQFTIRRTGPRGLFSYLWAVLALLASAANSQPYSEDPLTLFLRMDSAATPSQYRGLMTYERGEQLSTLQVVRSNVDGQLVEQIEVLSGTPGRLTRSVERLACDADAVEPGALKQPALTDYYGFHYLGGDLVAGRETQEILVVPRDRNRLVYLYSVDRDTGMMLRSIAMLPDRTVLERLQFVEFRPIEPDAGDAGLTDDGTQEISLQSWLDNCLGANLARAGWVPGWIPAGFVAVNAANDPERQSAELVYSDGIANISVFVEPIAQIAFPTESAQRGATAIHVGYLKLAEQVFMVTVAGEVPRAVLVEVARSMNYIAPADDRAAAGSAS